MKVLFITIEYDNGSTARMEFSGVHEPLEQSGTTYTGAHVENGFKLEDAISEAVTRLGLWPDDVRPAPRPIERTRSFTRGYGGFGS